jgi:hypothetical protein
MVYADPVAKVPLAVTKEVPRWPENIQPNARPPAAVYAISCGQAPVIFTRLPLKTKRKPRRLVRMPNRPLQQQHSSTKVEVSMVQTIPHHSIAPDESWNRRRKERHIRVDRVPQSGFVGGEAASRGLVLPRTRSPVSKDLFPLRPPMKRSTKSSSPRYYDVRSTTETSHELERGALSISASKAPLMTAPLRPWKGGTLSGKNFRPKMPSLLIVCFM